MACRADENDTTGRQGPLRPAEVPVDILEDALQVRQQAILGSDDKHTLLPPTGRDKRAEVLVRHDDADRSTPTPLRQDDMVVLAGDTNHVLGVEGHADVQLVLQTVEILDSQMAVVGGDDKAASNKLRLNAYAVLIANICIKNDINLHLVWIPRDINNIADFLSKTIDYEDYSITDDFYTTICADFHCTPLVDLFANSKNAKTKKTTK